MIPNPNPKPKPSSQAGTAPPGQPQDRQGSADASAPIFALVGRANKGKSSVVATLIEDDQVEISSEPGTTRRCHAYERRLAGRLLFSIVDTPGFEDAIEALRWLQALERDAGDRPRLIRAFVEQFRGSDRFREECELLQPILAGAAILYVVDGSHPYRPNYDAEMEILRWTGQPRMALINQIGTGDHSEEWRPTLNQYFSLVRGFDAHRAGHAERLGLLRALRELDEAGRPAVERAIATLEDEWASRRAKAARRLAELLCDALTFRIDLPWGEGQTLDPEEGDRLAARFHDELRRIEEKERGAVEALYQHEHLTRHEDAMARPLFARDLFAAQSWQILGLDQGQLVRAGVIGGAALGGAIDLGVGGTSFFTGTVVGGIVGGISSYLGGRKAAKARILFKELGGEVMRVGPIKSPNFPWILLDRALLHYLHVATRPHARREALILGAGTGPSGAAAGGASGAGAGKGAAGHREGVVHSLGVAEQQGLSRVFAQIQRKGPPTPAGLRQDLASRLEALIVRLTEPGPPR
jgi:hypothetical protein